MSRSSLGGAEVRWYLNDASLQGQFVDSSDFGNVLRELMSARARLPVLRQQLRSTRSLPAAMIAPQKTARHALSELRDKDLRAAIFAWLDRNGPFVDDERLVEDDDYFEYCKVDVTATGLGEAARRTKAGYDCATYSFAGGDIDYALDPLEVDHGLLEERLGRYEIANVWQVDALLARAVEAEVPARTWTDLIQSARSRFPSLEIGPLETHPALAREPFEASLRDPCLKLLKVLNAYVAGRNVDGSEGPDARKIIEDHFTGERAWFSGESPTNQVAYRREMTFSRFSGGTYFAHWHGKISHRFFRLHFEWPLEPNRKKLEIFYLGPKITKD